MLRAPMVMVSLLAFMLVAAVACHTTPGVPGGPMSSYPYAPAGIRIHSLSRFDGSETDGYKSLELWIEFLDPEGETSRGVGHIQANVTMSERPPVVASVNLDDPQVNAKAWDSPLRMYRIAVEIKPPFAGLPKPSAHITLTWMTREGARIVINTTVSAR
ncbi:MAG: hypothetical protein EXS03_06895 [Phycisphaerales bacterium]|nr:hypothetical protein [Phycisphaerales bacterium]